MNHTDHVQLIEAGLERHSGGVWADFGAGSGAFTLARATSWVQTPQSLPSIGIRRVWRRCARRWSRVFRAPGSVSSKPTSPADSRCRPSTASSPPMPSTTSRSGTCGPLATVEGVPPAGKPVDRGRVRRRNGEPLGAVSAVVHHLSGAGARSRFFRPVLLRERPSRWLASIYAALTFPLLTGSAVESLRRRS